MTRPLLEVRELRTHFSIGRGGFMRRKSVLKAVMKAKCSVSWARVAAASPRSDGP